MSQFAHTPYDGSAVPFTMGLAPCPEPEWMEPDENFAAHLREKDRYFREKRDTVYRAVHGSHAAEAELLSMLIEYLPRTFPDLYERDGEAIVVKPLDRRFDPADYGAPLTLAGRLVQEDLCLMRPLGTTDSPRHELASACLCFPSSWRLADKIGRPLEAIHDPVPTYAEELSDRVNRLFARIPPGKIMWRINWSLDEGEELHRPRPHSHDAWLDAGEDAADHIFIRTERQTIRRLPETGYVLFTIKIALDPLSKLAAHPQAPELALGLHGQLAALSADQAAYKGLSRARTAILQSLEALFA